MPSDLVWLLRERAVTHLRVFHWFSSKPGARCELLAEVITLNQKKTISGFGSTACKKASSHTCTRLLHILVSVTLRYVNFISLIISNTRLFHHVNMYVLCITILYILVTIP